MTQRATRAVVTTPEVEVRTFLTMLLTAESAQIKDVLKVVKEINND